MMDKSKEHRELYKSRVVYIGDIPMGGDNPVRIQSMTNTDTMDTEATVGQTMRLVDEGCEYVRITAPNIKAAEQLGVIKKTLAGKGCSVPLIADIHYTPAAAETAAKIIEKVRINPGNYIDKRSKTNVPLSDDEYAEELERLRNRLEPLILICREQGTAMRIGSNHGSLSPRIINRYGNTPAGMVEAALEFVRICRVFDYHDIVISMKASNTKIMVYAYRLLVKRMREEGMNYPLHLGVTEAGGGEEGRIKSAVGIGTLLAEGLGDTIRVSLTEDPEFEIPVAKKLVHRYGKGISGNIPRINAYEYKKRVTKETAGIGGLNDPVVISTVDAKIVEDDEQLKILQFKKGSGEKYYRSEGAPDFFYVGNKIPPEPLHFDAGIIADLNAADPFPHRDNLFPLAGPDSIDTLLTMPERISFLRLNAAGIYAHVESIRKLPNTVLILADAANVRAGKEVFSFLQEHKIENPVIAAGDYSSLPAEDFLLYAAADFGSYFIDGYGDGVLLEGAPVEAETANRILFGILQAAGVRITKTEFIACPSCGRTQFNLMETANAVKKRTAHLKGLKIGIMGCIVNGPGEMADADYGYVGSGKDKVTLYRGQEIVEKNIPSDKALDLLIELIKHDGRWRDP